MLRRHLHLNHIGVDLGHLDGFANQQIEPRRFFVDDRTMSRRAGLVQSLGLEQCGGSGADRSERRAQFVGQRIDQRGAQPLSFARRLHARRGLNGDGARHRNRHLWRSRRWQLRAKATRAAKPALPRASSRASAPWSDSRQAAPASGSSPASWHCMCACTLAALRRSKSKTDPDRGHTEPRLQARRCGRSAPGRSRSSRSASSKSIISWLRA